MSKPIKPTIVKPIQGGLRPSTPDRRPSNSNSQKGIRPQTPDSKPSSGSQGVKNGK